MTSCRLFVDVDTQHDFCHPEGALHVPGAPKIMGAVQALIGAGARRTDVLLVGSVDTHDFTAWEFAENGGPFPPHCLKGTPGWLKMPDTLPERSIFVPNVTGTPSPVPEGTEAIYFEKEVYSLFANPQAETIVTRLLETRRLRPSEVEAIVFGVATDYCIKAAALGLRERGFPVSVVRDATAAVADASDKQAQEVMRAAGCRFITTDEALSAQGGTSTWVRPVPRR